MSDHETELKLIEFSKQVAELLTIEIESDEAKRIELQDSLLRLIKYLFEKVDWYGLVPWEMWNNLHGQYLANLDTDDYRDLVKLANTLSRRVQELRSSSPEMTQAQLQSMRLLSVYLQVFVRTKVTKTNAPAMNASLDQLEQLIHRILFPVKGRLSERLKDL